MFSSEAATTSLRMRGPGILVGTAIMGTLASALVSAKTLPFAFGVVLLTFLASAAVRGAWRDLFVRPNSTVITLAAFLTYAAISSIWALVPDASLVTTLYGLLVAAATVLMLQLIDGDQRGNLLHMGEGLWIGFTAALLYLAIELASGQSIKILIYNLAGLQPQNLAPREYFTWSDGKLAAISREDLTRNMAPLTVLLWPAAAAVMGTVVRQYAAIFAVGLVLVAGAVTMLAWHETSKLTFVVGVLAFFGARYAPRFTGGFAAVVWTIACLGVVPLALLSHRFDLQDASWLQASARHRIVIWNATAERVLESPLLGVGARTTYYLGPSLEKSAPAVDDEQHLRTLSTHAHNVFLQTWFELGLVGASLLALFGLTLLQAIKAVDAAARPYAMATFISAACMAASSYSLWQYWFLAMFGLAAVACGLGIKLIETSSVERSA